MDCVDVDDQQQQPKFIMTCSSAPCHRGGDKSHLQKGRWQQTGEEGCLHRRWWCCPPSEKLDGLCCGQRWCSHCCSQNPSLTWWSGYKTKKYLYDCKKNHITFYTFLFFFFFFDIFQAKVPVTHLLHACTSVSRAKSRSVSNLWCIGDHLNSGMRNMVVRGPGLNCRRCSSVMGMPLKPRSTRRSRSSWAAARPWRACGMADDSFTGSHLHWDTHGWASHLRGGSSLDLFGVFVFPIIRPLRVRGRAGCVSSAFNRRSISCPRCAFSLWEIWSRYPLDLASVLSLGEGADVGEVALNFKGPILWKVPGRVALGLC